MKRLTPIRLFQSTSDSDEILFAEYDGNKWDIEEQSNLIDSSKAIEHTKGSRSDTITINFLNTLPEGTYTLHLEVLSTESRNYDFRFKDVKTIGGQNKTYGSVLTAPDWGNDNTGMFLQNIDIKQPFHLNVKIENHGTHVNLITDGVRINDSQNKTSPTRRMYRFFSTMFLENSTDKTKRVIDKSIGIIIWGRASGQAVKLQDHSSILFTKAH